MRDSLLRTAVWFGAAAVLMTEVLSLLHGLYAAPIAVCWLASIAVCARRIRVRPETRLGPVEWIFAGIIGLIVGTVALTALLYPPNSADAMAYHMPRVVYWAQAHHVAFFPTLYLNQIMLQPMTEYVMLHTWLLTGGDRLINLVACVTFAGCAAGVSAIAAALGLSARAQAMAAVLATTLPNAILQASGAKNDSMLALWLVCAVYFALRGEDRMLGLSVGLALATKGTAYLFLPPMLLALGAWRRRQLAWMAAGMLLLNAPQYVRNFQLSGSPLGFDSAQGDGFYRWRNDHLSWRALASNVARNTSEQLGARDPQWNAGVYAIALGVHRALGLDPNDPATTWPYTTFQPPVNANHEANANNRWHLLLLAIAAAVAARNRRWAAYTAGLIGGFLLFCLYLRWQLYLARLELPLFILAAPLGAWMLDRLRPAWLALVPCAFLIAGARLPALQNWTRPIQHRPKVAREELYFNDMHPWKNEASFVDAAAAVKRSGCGVVGIDINQFQLEYPLQALLRGAYFEHTGVENASARYADANAPRPCAIVCLECAGVSKRIELYRDRGKPAEFGRFLVFFKGNR